MSNSGPGVAPYFWLVLVAFLVAIATRRAKAPYALALVVTGMLIGVPRLIPQAHLDPRLLFLVFLPPLLFDSAINLAAEPLRRDWRPIAIYTLAGTIASTLIIGGLMTWLLHVPLGSALVFGALISTTDPISMIAVFRRLGAGPRLTLIMEAESLFNNDIAVVLFTIMLGLAAGGKFSMGIALWQFLRLVFGGALLGVAIGGLASRVHYELDDHLIEITLTTVVAFGSYISAEALHVSGVMAVVMAGLVIGNYGMVSTMSASTRLAVSAFWEYAAFVVNSIVFLLIGVEVAYVHWPGKIITTLGAVFVVLVGRAAIYPLSLLVNRLNGNIPRSWQHVMFWGGLRGALSMALVLGLDHNFPARNTLVAMTFGVVLFSLLVQGLTVGPLLRRLGLAGRPVVSVTLNEQRRLASEILACEAAISELQRFQKIEAYSTWAVELLLQEYRMRLKGLEEEIEQLQPGYRKHRELQGRQARQLAIAAEKNALHDATRRGWLNEQEWKQIRSRLDAELLALRSNSSSP